MIEIKMSMTLKIQALGSPSTGFRPVRRAEQAALSTPPAALGGTIDNRGYC
jgi:hypothetical protein